MTTHYASLEPEHPGQSGRLNRLVVVLVLVVVGLVLRLDGITSSLWLDEFGTLWVVEGTISETWRRAVDFQGQTPLYYLLVWATSQIFGETEFRLRLPSLLFGIGTVGVLGLTAGQLGGSRAGYLAAALSWLAFPFAMASSHARPYSLALFAAACTYYGFVRSALHGDRLGRFLWTFSGVLLGWAHYVQYAAVSGLVAAFATQPALRVKYPVRRFATDTAIQVALVMVALPQLVILAHRRDALSWIGQANHLSLLGLLGLFVFPILLGLSAPRPLGATTGDRLRVALLWSLLSQLLLLELLWVGGLNLITSRYAMVTVVPAVLLASLSLAELPRAERRLALLVFAVIDVVALGSVRAATGTFSGREQDWRAGVEALRAHLEESPLAPVLFRSGFVEDDAVTRGEVSAATLSPLRSPGRPLLRATILRLPYRWDTRARLSYFEESIAPQLDHAPVVLAFGDGPLYFDLLVEWVDQRWPDTFRVTRHRWRGVELLEFRR